MNLIQWNDDMVTGFEDILIISDFGEIVIPGIDTHKHLYLRYSNNALI